MTTPILLGLVLLALIVIGWQLITLSVFRSALAEKHLATLADVHTALLELRDLEQAKQATRASGRDLLRERIKERMAQAAARKAN